MAIIMKSSIKITKGFDTWQAMVKAQEDRYYYIHRPNLPRDCDPCCSPNYDS